MIDCVCMMVWWWIVRYCIDYLTTLLLIYTIITVTILIVNNYYHHYIAIITATHDMINYPSLHQSNIKGKMITILYCTVLYFPHLQDAGNLYLYLSKIAFVLQTLSFVQRINWRYLGVCCIVVQIIKLVNRDIIDFAMKSTEFFFTWGIPYVHINYLQCRKSQELIIGGNMASFRLAHSIITYWISMKNSTEECKGHIQGDQ